MEAKETDSQITFIAGDIDPSCSQKFAEFSNWYSCKIIMDGIPWNSSEHWFQAQKYINNPDYQEKIRLASTPGESCEMGRTREVPLRSDWETVKVGLMRRIQHEKFAQNEPLRRVLLSTAGKEIVEYHPRDKFWGNGGDDSGQNMLGKLLMEVRDTLASV